MPPHDSLVHYSAIWSAARDALSLTGVGSLIAGLFLITKSKGDAKLTIAQLRQKIEAEGRTADQKDLEIVSGQRTAATAELEKVNAAIKEQRDYWEKMAKAATAELDMRNARLSEFHTNFPELSDLLAIPGAMQCLKDNRDSLST